MSTTKNTKPHQQRPTETKLPEINDPNIEMFNSPEALKQFMDFLKPQIEFHKADEAMTMDDVKIYWDVRAVRGKDTPFAHLQGQSTLNQILAVNMLPSAPWTVEQEITNKILRPMVSRFQSEVNRMALEIVAADEGSEFPDDLPDDELA